MGERDRTPENDRRRLADDVRRTAGYMEAVVTHARRLNVPAPPAVSACVDLWRGWGRSIDRRAGEGE